MKLNEMKAKITIIVNENERKKLLKFLKEKNFEDLSFYEEDLKTSKDSKMIF